MPDGTSDYSPDDRSRAIELDRQAAQLVRI